MLDWLKTILGDAYTEDLEKKISEAIGKSFVARSDFNEALAAKKKLEEDLKERDRQLEELAAAKGATEDLQSQIKTLQQKNKEDKEKYEADILKIRLENAVDAALTKAGAKNNVAAKALLAEFLTGATLADDGTVKGLDTEIEALAKGEGTAFLFNAPTTAKQATFTGMQPGMPGGNPPPDGGKAHKDMTYEELCAWMEANPGQKL